MAVVLALRGIGYRHYEFSFNLSKHSPLVKLCLLHIVFQLAYVILIQ